VLRTLRLDNRLATPGGGRLFGAAWSSSRSTTQSRRRTPVSSEHSCRGRRRRYP